MSDTDEHEDFARFAHYYVVGSGFLDTYHAHIRSDILVPHGEVPLFQQLRVSQCGYSEFNAGTCCDAAVAQ